MKKEKSKNRQKEKNHRRQNLPAKKLVTNSRYADLLGLIMIILLGTIIYSNSFNCSFHLDDLNNIVDNAKIRDLFDVKTLWNYHQTRFIAYYTFALNYHFGQYSVWGYHLFNLVIHLLNACLVYWLALLIFSSPSLKDNPIIKHKNIIALFTALLFVSHPLATQSVTYIVQRMASMVAMFYLLSIALYVKARLTDQNHISRYFLFAGSLISAVLALFTKENAFTLPFAIVLFEVFFLQVKTFKINFKDYRIILFIIALVGIAIIILFYFSFGIFKPLPPSLDHTYTVTSLNYLTTQFAVIVKYIQLLFLPVNQNLDYDFLPAKSFFELRILLSFLFLVSLIILAIFLFKKNRLISFGIFWFFLTLSIESSIVPISDLIFEHRTYLPSFGFFLLISSGIYMLLWNKNKYLATSVFLIIIGTNSILAFNRNKIWKDELTLLSDVISKSPHKARPYVNRSSTFMDLGQWDKAITDCSSALKVSENALDAYNTRGAAYTKLGQWDKAVADYSSAIKIEPKFAKAYYNRGITYGNLGLWDKAAADYTIAIGIDPKIATIYYYRAVAYVNLGQTDKSIGDYSKAIEIDPKYSLAYTSRGIAYANLGQLDKAIADYSKAIGLDPKSANAYYNRAFAYGNLAQWDKSYADFSRVIEIDPEYTNARTNRDIALQKLNNEKKR